MLKTKIKNRAALEVWGGGGAVGILNMVGLVGFIEKITLRERQAVSQWEEYSRHKERAVQRPHDRCV